MLTSLPATVKADAKHEVATPIFHCRNVIAQVMDNASLLNRQHAQS